ncbi:ketopantoate reductase family protein [Margalitia sp. FSL K6-0131]|uniref:ketopantoate reductase family protein n=1 Tax=Margalitia sp. FSL K6-0131 TaxID=2954604 RepID=UPI0030FB31C0
MRIAIYGAGSLGTIVGAYLSKGNQNVELIDVNQEHIHTLNSSGATIVGTVNENVPVKAITPEEMSDRYDLVLLLTKQIFNKQVLENIKPYLSKNGVLLSLQNGVPEEAVSAIIGKDKVIGGSVEFGATWVKPGVSELTSAESAFKANAFQIGELDGTITERVQKIKEVLDLVGGTKISTNLVGTKWSKLMINIAMSGTSAVFGCTYGDVLNNETALETAIRLADETIKVGHSIGVKFVKMGGLEIEKFNLNKDRSNLNEAAEYAKVAFQPQALLKASMLQDLEKGKKCEIDYINGVVSSKGKEVGISTPFNDLLVELVHKAEQEKSVPDFDTNIVYFNELIDKGI